MFDNLSKAVPKAFQTLDRVIGESGDDEVRLYNSLTKNDFVAIAKEYGADNVSDYIQEMEKKRMKGR